MSSRRRWTDAEVEYVRANARRFTAEYMGLRINRTALAVRSKAHELGILISHWPDEDTQFLRENAKRMTARQIADALGLELSRVTTKAKNEGIRFGDKRKYHRPQG